MLKYEVLVGQTFLTALNDLSDIAMTPRMASRVSKIMEKIQECTKDYNEKHVDLIRKHAEFDEEGKPVINENKNIVLKQEGAEDFWKGMEELKQTEITIAPIHISDFGDTVAISPKTLVALKGVIVTD